MVVAFVDAIVVFPYRLYDFWAVPFEINGHGGLRRKACLLEAGAAREFYLDQGVFFFVARSPMERLVTR